LPKVQCLVAPLVFILRALALRDFAFELSYL
jgi:hypothetical protein